jgi:ABC-type transporter lipoprotein component MlaA
MIRKLAVGALVILMVSLLDACAATQQQPAGAQAAKNEGHADSLNAASSPQHPSGEQVPNFQEPSDPFEHFNEAMLTFNRKADDWVLRPTATDTPTSYHNPLVRAWAGSSRMSPSSRALQMICSNANSSRPA